ncbi:hypothetical protein [Planktotalea arctica]|uniref:hypothetical protein n=1 Tax=Planktotalea arctica TaxID=1481893 RepID=UPI00321A2EB3
MNLLRYLCFFPSFTFGLSAAEIFPYALLYGIVTTRRAKLELILFVLCLFLSALYANLITEGGSITREMIRSMMAYLNPLVIFAVVLRLPDREYEKLLVVARHVFIALCIVMVMQWSSLFGFLDSLIKAFVPRGSATPLGFRGVTLLATEPARAGIEFIFLYLIARSFWISKNRISISDLLVGFSILTIFKSASTLFIFGIFLTMFNPRLLLWGIPVAMYGIVQNLDVLSGRAFTLIGDLIALPLEDSLFLIINTSGNRVISIFAAIQYGFEYPFGGGIGNWQETSVEALFLTGYDYTQLNYFNAEWKEGALHFRASGYMMNLMMDMGIVGTSLATLTILALTRKFRTQSRAKRMVFYFFLLNIFFVGSVGTPVAWIATALLLRSTTNPLAHAEECVPQDLAKTQPVGTL